MGAGFAMGACIIVAAVIYQFKIWGLLLALVLNIGCRFYFKQRSDLHESEYHRQGKNRSGKIIGDVEETVVV